MQIKELLKVAFTAEASDLHLTEGMPPMLRIDGSIRPLDNFSNLEREQLRSMIYSVLSKRQIEEFEKELQLDSSICIDQLARFRVNVHKQRGVTEAAFRIIPSRIKSLDELGLPPIVADLARRPRGLVLITGPAAVGKSTTLASMIELINIERKGVIITIEDPIEYTFVNRNCIIKQREVGNDARSFASALKSALRQDPNVIMVGDTRDLETISIVITAAETGHLVLSTLHTPDAAQTIDRIIDVFPAQRQDEIKTQLADCLEGIVSQQLLPRADGKGRIVATEVMIATPAVRYLIKRHDTQQLARIIQTSLEFGMRTMDKSIKELYNKKLITYQTAMSKAKNIEDFHRL